jgi:predicted ribosome quality control (RQC) complex YloA/Tae2 family protein
MKPRLTALDLAALLPYLKTQLVGSRLVNAYDGANPKTFLLKFGRSAKDVARLKSTANDDSDFDDEDDEDESASKLFLLIESGARIHTATDRPETGAQPSGFAMKLRKHLKKRRVGDVRMLGGFERAAEIVFGDGGPATCGFDLDWSSGLGRVECLILEQSLPI